MNNLKLTVCFISFIAFFFMSVSTVNAEEDEKSMEELKLMRDELKNNVEQLHEDIEEAKSKQDEEEDIEYEKDEEEEEVKSLHEEIKKTNQAIKEELKELEGIISESQGYKDEDTREELEEEIENLREELEDVQDDLNSDLEDLQEEIAEAKEEMQEELEELEEEAEEKSHAASFVFSPSLMWLDKDPLKLLNTSDGNLIGKHFNFNNDKTFMLGFMNYYDIENGFRIGSNISGGYKKFECDPFTTTMINTTLDTAGNIVSADTNYVDSIITLHVIPAHIGFVCEKVFSFIKWDIFTGFMVGGGVLVVVKNNKLYTVNDIFIGTNDDDTLDQNNYSAVVASSFMWDIHAGTAVEVTPKFHIGVDAVLLFSYASNGFNGSSLERHIISQCRALDNFEPALQRQIGGCRVVDGNIAANEQIIRGKV